MLFRSRYSLPSHVRRHTVTWGFTRTSSTSCRRLGGLVNANVRVRSEASRLNPRPGLPPLNTLQALPHSEVSVPVWAAVAYLIAGPTVGTYYLNLYALRSVPSSTVALFVYLQPFITTAAAMVFLGETPGIRALISAIIAFAGVWLAARPRAAG